MMDAGSRLISLHDLGTGEEGTVEEMHGGYGFIRRMQSMGIRPGKRIKKISAQFFLGPVTVKVENTVIAIGHGMSRKVMVRVSGK